MTDTTTKTVEAIRKGEYVRRNATTMKTYKRGDYDRSTKRYALISCDDVSREIYVKAGTMLVIGFTY